MLRDSTCINWWSLSVVCLCPHQGSVWGGDFWRPEAHHVRWWSWSACGKGGRVRESVAHCITGWQHIWCGHHLIILASCCWCEGDLNKQLDDADTSEVAEEEASDVNDGEENEDLHQETKENDEKLDEQETEEVSYTILLVSAPFVTTKCSVNRWSIFANFVWCVAIISCWCLFCIMYHISLPCDFLSLIQHLAVVLSKPFWILDFWSSLTLLLALQGRYLACEKLFQPLQSF